MSAIIAGSLPAPAGDFLRDGVQVALDNYGVGFEDPPSRTRHFVSNLRIAELDDERYRLKTNVLLYRNRADDPGHDLLSAERHDIVFKPNGEWKLLERLIYIDQATLGTLNLSIFL